MASTKICDLVPALQKLFRLFEKGMLEAGISFKLTCTARTYKEQLALYAQGRQSLLEVNKLRKAAGLPGISQKENTKKVTWTLNSKHIINPEKGITQAKAFDIVLLTDGRPHWDLKVDVDKDLVPDYKEAANVGRSVGLLPGADFKKNPDYPHFELAE